MIHNLFPTAVGIYKLDRDLTDKEIDFIKGQDTRPNMGNITSTDNTILRNKPLIKIRDFIETSIADYFKTIHNPKHDVSLKITQASSYREGIAAEYDWIRRNLPGWSRDSQALMGGPDGRSYDVLTLVKGSQKKTVCFDITDVWKLMPG